jgi:hypothetical protein
MQGVGCRVQGVGCRVYGLGLMLGFAVKGVRLWVCIIGCKVMGFVNWGYIYLCPQTSEAETLYFKP